MRLLRSLLRIAAASAGLLALVTAAGIALVRQPSLTSSKRLVRGSADPKFLERHVAFLTEAASPRDFKHPENLERAAEYVEGAFRAQTAEVASQPYVAGRNPYRNIVASFGPPGTRPLVVGAHYDAFGDTNVNPGADDNASGVAGLLEVARLLSGRPLKGRVLLVAYSTEEPPFYHSDDMGSAVHARSLHDAGVHPVGVVSLEMLGFYASSQPWPHPLFGIAYPRTGDFIAVVGRWRDRAFIRSFRRGINGASSVPAYSYSGPAVAGIEASDQSSYWPLGFPGIMVTDTAFLRNPNYHAPTDVKASLDYGKMAEVVTGVANAVHVLCGGTE